MAAKAYEELSIQKGYNAGKSEARARVAFGRQYDLRGIEGKAKVRMK